MPRKEALAGSEVPRKEALREAVSQETAPAAEPSAAAEGGVNPGCLGRGRNAVAAVLLKFGVPAERHGALLAELTPLLLDPAAPWPPEAL